jgi:hypothetical protein
LLVPAWNRAICALFSILLLCVCLAAFGQTFDQMLGNYAQRKSGVCVLHGHVLAVAETYPASIEKMCHEVYGGWMVVFPDGRRTYVAQAEIDKSLADSWMAGEPDNIHGVVTLGLCIRTGGYNRETGMLDYGKNDFGKFMGSGDWTGYGNENDPDHTLACGFERLARETGPDHHVKIPATIGFAALDKKALPKYAAECAKYKLVGEHDFSISGYDAATRCALLRNPHRPKDLLPVPVKLLLKIPCGMDFLEPKAS